MKVPSTDGEDHPTPKTDALINKMLHGDGIPRCKEWEKLEEHAREMERLVYVYRELSVAYLRQLTSHGRT
jgi:hypothetical protein